MTFQAHRRASEDYQNRVDARLKQLGHANFTYTESRIVDEWSCLDLLAESCAEYLAAQRTEPTGSRGYQR